MGSDFFSIVMLHLDFVMNFAIGSPIKCVIRQKESYGVCEKLCFFTPLVRPLMNILYITDLLKAVHKGT